MLINNDVQFLSVVTQINMFLLFLCPIYDHKYINIAHDDDYDHLMMMIIIMNIMTNNNSTLVGH